MFCANCGHPMIDGKSFCENCGNPVKAPAVPVQAPTAAPQYQYPYQTPPAANMAQLLPVQKKQKKSHKGLIIGLVALGAFLITATLLVIFVLVPWVYSDDPAGTSSSDGISVVGLWSSEELGEVLQFKSSGSIVVNAYDGDTKGTYEYDQDKAKGTITLEDTDYTFKVSEDEINIKDMGVFTKETDKDFDIDTFIHNTGIDAAISAIDDVTLEESTAAKADVSAAATVTAKSMDLTLSFGDCSGTYTGEVKDGLPDGYGTFMSADSDGDTWTYEGNWAAGHLSGQGKTTWDYGYTETGEYQNDCLNGQGQDYWMDVMRYSGSYTNGNQNGTGTLYNCHSEEIFTGSLNYGFLQETAEQRSARVGAFKDQSIPATYDELYQACSNVLSIRARVKGTVLQVYEYSENNQYYCDFLMYESGIADTGRIVMVYHRLSEGEPKVTEGQSVTVWGTTEYLYNYTSDENEDLSVPLIESWSVE